MDSERAERHLRLAAEAALRRARTLPREAGQVRPRDVLSECLGRLRGIATALVSVGAVDADRAEAIMDEFQAALSARHLHAMTVRPLPVGRLLPVGRPRPAAPARPVIRAAPATGSPRPDAEPAPSAGIPRGIPVSRMLRLRDGDVTGELYVMSLVVTATHAAAPAVARIRRRARDTTWAPAPTSFPPFGQITAADDRETRYHVGAQGGGLLSRWTGHLNIQPGPPAGARWLDLNAGDDASVRIDLTGTTEVASAVIEPLSARPGDQLLENVAQQILAAAADDPHLARQAADSTGDTVRALEAAGALSPLSPAPGHLATVCGRLGIDGHGITARPTPDLPEPWLSVLACYGRRHRHTVRDGTATVAVTLPELNGARVVLAGLHTLNGQTYLHVLGCGWPASWSARRFGPGMLPAFGWWLQDDAGHWHVAVQRQWTEGPGGETFVMLRVVPPLGRETASGTLFVTTPEQRAAVRVPLSWWAVP